MAYGIFWAEEVIFNVILIIKFSFEFQLQDGHHMENIFRSDLIHIPAGASMILMGFLIKWINNSNDDDNDITNPNFNDFTIESLEWINNFIPHFMDIISYLCRDQR